MICLCLLALGLGVHAGGLCSSALCSPVLRLPTALKMGALTAVGTLGGSALCRMLPLQSTGSALAFALLCGRGGRLLLESLRPLEEEQTLPSRGTVLGSVLFFAFAAGFALSFLGVSMAASEGLLTVVVFLTTALWPPRDTHPCFHRWAWAGGGLALTGVGVKILLDALL